MERVVLVDQWQGPSSSLADRSDTISHFIELDTQEI